MTSQWLLISFNYWKLFKSEINKHHIVVRKLEPVKLNFMDLNMIENTANEKKK